MTKKEQALAVEWAFVKPSFRMAGAPDGCDQVFEPANARGKLADAWGLICTRPRYHHGPHVAHLDNEDIALIWNEAGEILYRDN
jgi:hypothetical protein